MLSSNILDENINNIFEDILRLDSIEAIKILFKYNFNWKEKNFILYRILNRTYVFEVKSTNLYYYFYDLYKSLSLEELKAIPNILNIFSITKSSPLLNSLLELIKPLLDNENKKIIKNRLLNLYLNEIVSLNLHDQNSNVFIILELLLSSNILEQSYNILNDIDCKDFEQRIKLVLNRFISSQYYKKNVLKFFKICEKYDIKPTKELQNILSKYNF